MELFLDSLNDALTQEVDLCCFLLTYQVHFKLKSHDLLYVGLLKGV